MTTLITWSLVAVVMMVGTIDILRVVAEMQYKGFVEMRRIINQEEDTNEYDIR